MPLLGYPPKVFIIGAQKSGTTQLADLLNQHPDVCLSEPKEPDLFSRFWSKGLATGKTHFGRSDAICVDASTSYSSACLPQRFSQDIGIRSDYNGVPAHIAEVSPDARFIYLLRDPVSRTYSGYWHQVRAGLEQRPFEQAIKEDTYYLRTSHYLGQLEQYLEHFPLERFLILTFEDLISEPQAILNCCFRFLGLSEQEINIEGAKNQSFVYNGAFAVVNRLLTPVGGLNNVVKKVKPLIPRKILEWGAKGMTQPVPKIGDKEYALLSGFFDESIEGLEALVGRRFEQWKSRR